MVICLLLTFIFYYKAPISLNNSSDSEKILNLISENYPNDEISDLLFLSDIDLSYSKSIKDSIESFDVDVEDTKAVYYKVKNDSTSFLSITIFEVKYGLFKEIVGKELVTMRYNR